jgi:hypothetical protein
MKSDDTQLNERYLDEIPLGNRHIIENMSALKGDYFKATET